MSNLSTELFSEAKLATVSKEDLFLFDLQGFLLLRGVLSPEECTVLLETIRELEQRSYEEDERLEKSYRGHHPQPTKDVSPGRLRLNGLLRLDPVFDGVIDHPGVLPFLEAFLQQPQLVNTWSISKFKGEGGGNWHRGRSPTHYTYRNGIITSRMLNTVWFLTDNGPDDGCMVALPGGHKSNVDLNWSDYKSGLTPGAVRVTGKAGDVFIFSVTVLHSGIPKSTEGRRTNLYYNWTTRDFNVMTYSPQHNYHFCMPPSIRARFTTQRRALTEWMEYMQAQESIE